MLRVPCRGTLCLSRSLLDAQKPAAVLTYDIRIVTYKYMPAFPVAWSVVRVHTEINVVGSSHRVACVLEQQYDRTWYGFFLAKKLIGGKRESASYFR